MPALRVRRLEHPDAGNPRAVRRRLQPERVIPAAVGRSQAPVTHTQERSGACVAVADPRGGRDGMLSEGLLRLEDILREMNALRQDARRAPPDWSAVIPAHPVSRHGTVDRPVLRADVLRLLRSLMPSGGQGDGRTSLMSIPASAGTGKSYLLQDIARLSTSGFAGCSLESDLAAWASKLVVFAINFNSHFLITTREARLVKNKILKTQHLVHLRLVFFELADLSSARSVFDTFLDAVEEALRNGRCTKKIIRREALALLRSRGGRGPHDAPVVLFVDEVAKILSLKSGDMLAKLRVAKGSSDSLRDARATTVSKLLAAATSMTDKVDGVTFASSLSYMTAANAATLSGRDVRAVSDLFCSDPEQLSSIIYEGLRALAKKGFMMTRDAQACLGLYHSLKSDVFITRVADSSLNLSNLSAMELKAAAQGLSYLCGGHMRTAVMLSQWLETAGSLVTSTRPHVSIRYLLEEIEMASSSEAADRTWSASTPADIDQVLSYVLLNIPVKGNDAVFCNSRAVSSPLSSSRMPTVWDEARHFSVVQGAGKVFRPRLSPIGLYQVLQGSQAQGCLLYGPLAALLRQKDTTPDERWEQAGCDLEWLQSCCRSLHPSLYKRITLADLFRSPHAAYVGGGSLLNEVCVDASHAREGCTRSDLQVLLAQAATGDDNILLDQVHLPLHGAASLDAAFFFRVVGGQAAGDMRGKVIMVGVQFKHSKVGSNTGVYPETVFKDWDNLPAVLGEHYDEWLPRFVYLNYADRKVSTFPRGLSRRSIKKAVPKFCAEHSMVRGRYGLDASIGSSAHHLVRSMDWLYRCQVTSLR